MRGLTALVMMMAALLVAAPPAHAQPDLSRRIGHTVADSGAPGYRFETIRLPSSDGARHYRIRIAIPRESPPATGYPLAWLLDGNAALMEVDQALMKQLSEAASPPVLAFVASDNDLRIDPDARAFDYTPRRAGSDADQADVIPGRRNGGADAFLALLHERVLPAIDEHARIDRTRQAIWGHSYGGLLVLHALFTQPRLFETYGAADPSLWWGEGALLKSEPAIFQPDWQGRRLRVWTGSKPDGARGQTRSADPAVVRMQRARASVPADAAVTLVNRLQGLGLSTTSEVLAGRGHGETLGASLRLYLLDLAAQNQKTEGLP